MTITYATDHAAFENTIQNWLETHATFNNRVRQADQEGVRPEPPSATYQIISDGAMDGIDSEFFQHNPEWDRLDNVVSGPRRMTVQVVVYTVPGLEDMEGRSARVRLNGALAALRSPSVREIFTGVGLAFLQVLSAPRQADEQLGDRWERRMQCDIEFGYTSLITDLPTSAEEGGTAWIENASIDVTFEE